MQEKSRLTFGLIDLLLLLGCLGVIEMVIVIVYWDTIALNDNFAFLRPRQPLEKFSLLALIAGLIGLFNYASGLFTETAKIYIYRKYLAITFLTCLSVLGFFYIKY